MIRRRTWPARDENGGPLGYPPLGIQRQIIRSAGGFRHVRFWHEADLSDRAVRPGGHGAAQPTLVVASGCARPQARTFLLNSLAPHHASGLFLVWLGLRSWGGLCGFGGVVSARLNAWSRLMVIWTTLGVPHPVLPRVSRFLPSDPKRASASADWISGAPRATLAGFKSNSTTWWTEQMAAGSASVALVSFRSHSTAFDPERTFGLFQSAALRERTPADY